MTRRGARAATLVAFVAMALVAIEAAARAQQADGQSDGRGPDAVVAAGVTVAGLPVGGLTADEAEDAVAELAGQPVTVSFRDQSWRFAPQTLGARAEVDTAVKAALGAPAHSELPLRMAVDRQALAGWTQSFADAFDQKRRNARVELRGLQPKLTPSRMGRTLEREETEAAVLAALEGHDREAVQLAAQILRPTVTNADITSAVVIKRASNRLIFYRPGGPNGMRVAKRFNVATGQPSFPTPLGNYEIVRMQRDPWWIPPPSDWAKDAEPVPPGPGNPLGTRWMGISSPAVGIHGTPDAASIGYSASHGCIRMLVPEAEWLFERVDVGTPVYILDA